MKEKDRDTKRESRTENSAPANPRYAPALKPASFTRIPAALDPLIVTALFVIALFLVPPKGEFPINDDWDYYATVGDFVRYGEMRLSDWPAMSLVAQVVWGGLFAKILGLSYWTLRLSVITLTFAGSLALYYWARVIGRTRQESLFLALLYATTPMVFVGSYSFMTDVPAASVTLICLCIQAYCWRRGGVRLYLLAGATGAAGYLIRQTAALPVLVLAASLVPALIRKKARPGDVLALIIPLAVAAAARSIWLEYIHGVPYQSSVVRFEMLSLSTILQRFLQQALAIGVFLSPLLICLVGRRASLRSWGSSVGRLVLVGALVVSLMQFAGIGFPPFWTQYQYLGDLYLGFETLPSQTLLGPHIKVASWSIDVFFVTKAVGLLSLSLAVALLVSRRRPRWASWRRYLADFSLSPGGQAGLCCLALGGLMLVQKNAFDRYLIPIIPVCAMYFLSRMPRDQGLLGSPASWILLGAFAFVSVAGTQDFFARQRERWHAIDYLVQQGIPRQDISAGFEPAALYAFNPVYRQPTRVRPFLLALSPAERESRMMTEDPTRVWQKPRHFAVRYDSISTAQPVAHFSWHSWFRSGTVYIYSVGERSKAATARPSEDSRGR